MNQFTLEIVSKFVAENDFKFRPSQARLCFPVLARIYKKMKIGIKFARIKVDGDIIVDGHHRYLCSLLAEVPIESDPWHSTSSTKVESWSAVSFTKEDWYSEAGILILDERDAIYNGMSLEQMNHLLN